MNSSSWNKLLNKNMNRREFLVHMAVGILTITGISGVIKSLSELDKDANKSNSNSAQRTTSLGYNSGAYGGPEDGKS